MRLLIALGPKAPWVSVREFVWTRSGQRFNMISDYMEAELKTAEEEQMRDDTLRVIVQALEAGDFALLEPSDEFTVPASREQATAQPSGI